MDSEGGAIHVTPEDAETLQVKFDHEVPPRGFASFPAQDFGMEIRALPDGGFLIGADPDAEPGHVMVCGALHPPHTEVVIDTTASDQKPGLSVSLKYDVMGWYCGCWRSSSKAILAGKSGPEGGSMTIRCGCGTAYELTARVVPPS